MKEYETKKRLDQWNLTSEIEPMRSNQWEGELVKLDQRRQASESKPMWTSKTKPMRVAKDVCKSIVKALELSN